ncbi:MAG: U32 family peptidase, partial [Lachnospiraceae bacterium]|nr:U32 family peptidase [Lachnospiraceae bacterium]
MDMRKPEILAPAGSMQALRAVIAAGCDAVYMGGSRFGARAYADNPEGEEMVRAIQYCHLHGVKLYLTVNTLLKEGEISELYDFLLPYYEAGVDAVLVQDMGVLSALHQWFPDLKLHASTQMTITQGRTAEFLKDFGITGIVPARELSLSELRKMRQETDTEIEVFVHGALCYCYSGGCLFSSMQGGRSGNRGRCAQPCRQRYRMEGTGKEGYFLSPKELCALSHLDELVRLGVDS